MGRQANKLKVDECQDILFSEFLKFKDPRPICEIPLVNFLMSSYAVFSLKSPSLLQFERDFKNEQMRRKHNLKHLFRVERVPSDTHLRDVLDRLDYKQYRPIFKTQIRIYSHQSNPKNIF